MTTTDTRTGTRRADEDLQRVAKLADAALDGADAETVIRWAAAEFGHDMAVASSMTDGVLAHLVSRALPDVDVLFLDTGYHFAETVATRDEVAKRLPVRVLDITPVRTVAQQDAEFGPQLHDRDPGACCRMRKVEPLQKALDGYDAWVTGVRRSESESRRNSPVVSWDAGHGLVKVNPIATWTDRDVDAYMTEHDIIRNPLLDQGYPSIGCGPCTRRVEVGEDQRAGRWEGFEKTECGIHGHYEI